MKRTLLFALVLAACGDDDGSNPGDDGTTLFKDASTRDATLPGNDAARDGAAALLDANIDVLPPPDASAPPDASVVDAASFDAATATDAGSECVAEGEDCQQGSCCDGTACVTSTAFPYPACLATCEEDSDCDSGCCTALNGSAKVCAEESYCEEEDPFAPLVENCIGEPPYVYGRSDVFMGIATYSSFEDDGVCSIGGDYARNGSKGPLWPSNGAYGATTFGAPEIRCEGNVFNTLAYISKAKSSQDGVRVIDPDNLCQVLRNSNL